VSNRTDNFDRADTTNNIGTPSDAGSAWTQSQGTWGIASNAGYESSAAGAQNIAQLEASLADVDVQVTLSNVSAGADAGPVARFADTSNYLLWIYTIGSSGLRMFKVVAGSFTQLGSTASYTAANGDVLKFTVNGSTLNGYVNGALKVGPQTESAGSTNTKHGLRSFNDSASRFDDFSIVDNSGGGDTLMAQACF
jgi:hypothetical protein